MSGKFLFEGRLTLVPRGFEKGEAEKVYYTEILNTPPERTQTAYKEKQVTTGRCHLCSEIVECSINHSLRDEENHIPRPAAYMRMLCVINLCAVAKLVAVLISPFGEFVIEGD